ncbi:hypothetical protein XENOCAPTIV_029797 [Xenoophorus captivus]|uniref:Uncharacterized protein n=1 Tax=Xenoophorus captivus TaxID=1517983 RepID=A0ABV0Q6T3_9TELE
MISTYNTPDYLILKLTQCKIHIGNSQCLDHLTSINYFHKRQIMLKYTQTTQITGLQLWVFFIFFGKNHQKAEQCRSHHQLAARCCRYGYEPELVEVNISNTSSRATLYRIVSKENKMKTQKITFMYDDYC